VTRFPGGSVITLFVTYCVLTAAAFLYGDRCVAALLPLLAKEIDWLMPAEFSRQSLSLTASNGEPQIALQVVTTTTMMAPSQTVGVGAAAASTTLQAYALEHFALVFAILAAWPVRSLHRRIWLLALGVPCVLLSISLDIPFVLTGLLRELWLGHVAPVTVDTDPLIVYYRFLHRGGRIGLAVAAAVTAALTIAYPGQASNGSAACGAPSVEGS
jgi:hypothetical protein